LLRLLLLRLLLLLLLAPGNSGPVRLTMPPAHVTQHKIHVHRRVMLDASQARQLDCPQLCTDSSSLLKQLMQLSRWIKPKTTAEQTLPALL
jgi:hypothetical protein